MKKPIIAFILSFLLPGAGLVYLGKWKWGFINFGIVLLIGVAAVSLFSDETFYQYCRYISLGCGGSSGVFAQTLAKQINQKGKTNDVP